MSVKASVIIPARHAIGTICESLKSLQLQNASYLEEVIVVENGSKELQSIKMPQNFKLIQLKQGNRSIARNKGAEIAKSPILVFLDADVELAHGWLENVIKSFQADTDVVVTPIVPSSKKNDLLMRYRFFRVLTKTGGSFISLKKKSPDQLVINSAAFAIKKNVFQKLNGFDPYLFRHEDLDFSQRLFRIPVKVRALVGPSCKVYFDGGLLRYLKREYDQAYEKVRYFEKWDSRSWKGSLVLFKHLIHWTRGAGKIFSRNHLDQFGVLVSFCALMGNLAGVLRKVFNPYPSGKIQSSDIVAEIEYL